MIRYDDFRYITISFSVANRSYYIKRIFLLTVRNIA